MEKSDNKLTRQEKATIFEYVNDLYLKLKGNKKKQTKASFKDSWKEDNLLFIMMMKLNSSYEMWDNHEENPDWIFERDIKLAKDTSSIPKLKHQRMMSMLRQNECDMEVKLEEIKEGKGYISEEQHKEEMKKQLEEQQELIREQGDRVAKLRILEKALREKLDAANRRTQAQKLYYEDQMKLLSSD